MLQDSKAKSFKTLKSADKWLKNGDELKKLFQKQQYEQNLKQILCEASGLDDESFYVASSTESTLLLQTNNAVVATQLRLASKELISKLNETSIWKNKFDKVKVVVRPLYQKQRSSQKSLQGISTENADLLEEVASYTEDPKLKAVLKRIAQHRTDGKEN